MSERANEQKICDAENWLRYSSHSRDIILLEMYKAFKAANFDQLERTMSKLDTDINSLKQKVSDNTALESQLLQKLKDAISNSDDPSDDATVQTILSQLDQNNAAMTAALNPGTGDTGGGTVDPGTGGGGTVDPGTGDGGVTGVVGTEGEQPPVTGADVIK